MTAMTTWDDPTRSPDQQRGTTSLFPRPLPLVRGTMVISLGQPIVRLLFCVPWLPLVRSAVIQDVWGANRSELLFASSGGGTHVYLSGVDIGSAFAPPVVLIGALGHIECRVQPFTSAKNRMHCIVSADRAPAPLTTYNPSGFFVSMPIRSLVRGQLAECWHQGAAGDNCAVRFDVGGTPRVLRVLTQTVESAGTLRLSGEGIDGGLRGAQRLAATLYRGAVPVLGACGEKDCQASNMGAETLGCSSRPDAGGSGISGGSEENQRATAFSDATRFGCVLEELTGGLTGGFFNLSLTAIADSHHRGDAYLGFLQTKLIDVATGAPPSAAERTGPAVRSRGAEPSRPQTHPSLLGHRCAVRRRDPAPHHRDPSTSRLAGGRHRADGRRQRVWLRRQRPVHRGRGASVRRDADPDEQRALSPPLQPGGHGADAPNSGRRAGQRVGLICR